MVTGIEPTSGTAANALVDLTGRNVSEFNGPESESKLMALTNTRLPIRGLSTVAGQDIYRLTNARALVIGGAPVEHAINVTGGTRAAGGAGSSGGGCKGGRRHRSPHLPRTAG